MADERKSGESAELLLVDQGLGALPEAVAKAKGPTVTSLNLSENKLTTGKHLQHFVRLDTLVLDKNGLRDLPHFPKLPTVKTLWFNNNLVVDLKAFLDQVTKLFPALTYLSFMRNPASPSMVCISEEDAAAMRRYRLYVIYRIPRLTFLDSSPVSQTERSEAMKRGQFLVPRRPSAPTTSAAFEPEDAGASRSRPTSTAAPVRGSDRRPAAFLGLGTSNYDGRHSEGNRFIGDDHL